MPELPTIVRERLKVSRATATLADADVLTAFGERALPESERAVVAEHLARCHDCRDVLVLALPASVTVEAARLPLPVGRGCLRGPPRGRPVYPLCRRPPPPWRRIGSTTVPVAVTVLAPVPRTSAWQGLS